MTAGKSLPYRKKIDTDMINKGDLKMYIKLEKMSKMEIL